MDIATIGSWLAAANSAKSLLGGVFGGSKDEGDSMKSQYAWNALSTLNNPLFQVRGLRKAGLNPMLAVGKGMQTGPTVTAAPGAQDNAETNRQNAATQATAVAAQVENLRTNSAKNLAEADLAKAKEQTERNMPANVEQSTKTSAQLAKVHETHAALTRQLEATEGWKTKQAITKHYMDKLEYELAEINLSPLRKAEADRAIALARSAKTQADVDEALLMIERAVGIGAEGLGAVSGVISSASGLKRALDALKPRTTTRSGSSYQKKGSRRFEETTTVR